MFDRGTDALTLYALDVSDRDARGEKRVFAEVFKVPTVHWSAINVYTGSQEKMHALGTRVTSNLGAYALGQRWVPCCRQANARGHRGGRSKIADTDRAICHLQSR